MGKIEGKVEKSLLEKLIQIEKINKGRFSSGENMLFTHQTLYHYYRSTGLYGRRCFPIYEYNF